MRAWPNVSHTRKFCRLLIGRVASQPKPLRKSLEVIDVHRLPLVASWSTSLGAVQSEGSKSSQATFAHGGRSLSMALHIKEDLLRPLSMKYFSSPQVCLIIGLAVKSKREVKVNTYLHLACYLMSFHLKKKSKSERCKKKKSEHWSFQEIAEFTSWLVHGENSSRMCGPPKSIHSPWVNLGQLESMTWG